ncbi:MAG: hypothetical protein KA155_08030 [Alphaproteobacteria bacterium]|nr:hypothetical protein [Alphaproteobacteria bacterium]
MDKTKAETVSLKAICKEKKLCPRLSRMLLREAVKDTKRYPALAKAHKARTPWMWTKGSKELQEAMTALKPAEASKSAI